MPGTDDRRTGRGGYGRPSQGWGDGDQAADLAAGQAADLAAGQAAGQAADLGALAGGVAGRARDAAYVAVGLGVLGLQRAQFARRRLVANTSDVDQRVAQVASGLSSGAQQLAGWLESTLAFVGAQLRPLEEQLPDGPLDRARDLADRARAQVQAWSSQPAQPGGRGT